MEETAMGNETKGKTKAIGNIWIRKEEKPQLSGP